MADFGDRTQEATPHRRRQAREQGQVAKSQDLASAVLLVGAVVWVLAQLLARDGSGPMLPAM